MSEEFSNNPFQRLARKIVVPSGKGAQATEPMRQPKKAKAPASVSQMVDTDADATLFLQAMGDVPHSKGKKKAPDVSKKDGHALEESESFRQLLQQEEGSMKKNKTKQLLPAKQSTPPIAQNADSAEPASDPIPEEEQDFWLAMKEVSPLSGKGRDVAPEVQPAVALHQAENALQDFMDGKLEFTLSLTGEYLEGHVVGLDDITMNKLRAGQYSPETHLDLHGLNTAQAFQALLGFFRGAWYKGMRTVLVVPGRGRNSPDGVGILRDKLQDWLTQEPLKRVVLAFCTARPVDGGPGSIYVLLRKYRKKGKICWERMPADPDLF